MSEWLLLAITFFLAVIAWKVTKIDERLKERFPTEKEADFQWAMKDPMGHAEAHKKDREQTK
jgi:hypothetical protein